MTDSRETAVISEALGVIDKALREMLQRELVSTGEVADLLLDVRSLLTASATNLDPRSLNLASAHVGSHLLAPARAGIYKNEIAKLASRPIAVPMRAPATMSVA